MPFVRTKPAPTPLEGVLTSPARFRTARLLVRLPDKEFTGRELAELVGVSHSAVQEALGTMIRENLISFRVAGRAHLYRVNKESHLYAALNRLFRDDRSLDDAICQEIRSALDRRVASAVLFGSRARGTARPDSDVDLLVVSRGGKGTEETIGRLQTRIARGFGLHLDAKVLTRVQLRKKAGTPYVLDALAEGRLIAGVPLREVLDSAA